MNLLKLSVVSVLTSIPVSTLRRLSAEGKFPAFKVGKSYRVKEVDLEKWLEDLKEKGALTPSSDDLDTLENLASVSEVD